MWLLRSGCPAAAVRQPGDYRTPTLERQHTSACTADELRALADKQRRAAIAGCLVLQAFSRFCKSVSVCYTCFVVHILVMSEAPCAAVELYSAI